MFLNAITRSIFNFKAVMEINFSSKSGVTQIFRLFSSYLLFV